MFNDSLNGAFNKVPEWLGPPCFGSVRGPLFDHKGGRLGKRNAHFMSDLATDWEQFVTDSYRQNDVLVRELVWGDV